MAFIEFTERGNFFDRNKFNTVLEHIKEEEKHAKNGIMLIPFLHGWHHSASHNSNNVRKFKELLRIISKPKNNFLNKKVIGVYIGWRGRAFPEIPIIKDIPIINNVDPDLLTFWGRKSVAKQIGSGGVSEVFLKLEKIIRNPKKKNENANIFVIIGHSFGSVVALSALKDILLERVIDTEHISTQACIDNIPNPKLKNLYKNVCQEGCVKTRRFADAIMLLNPALEANELLQIKTLLSEEHCYSQRQEKLIHILSSESDSATNTFFPLGQFIGVSTNKSEIDINRTIFNIDTNQDKNITLQEWELDLTTVGNYQPFRTAKHTGKFTNVHFSRCHGNASCVDDEYKASNFPVSPYEPISIISVDKDFMGGHNDIFNENVIAYVSSAVLENQYKRYKYKISDALKEHNPNISNIVRKSCYSIKNRKTGKEMEKFNFRDCSLMFYKLYKKDFDNFRYR